jgi:hypothetical protein
MTPDENFGVKDVVIIAVLIVLAYLLYPMFSQYI